jgi:hypothetical protein
MLNILVDLKKLMVESKYNLMFNVEVRMNITLTC